MKKFLALLFIPILSMAQGGQGYGNLNRPQVVKGFEITGNIEGLKDNTELTLLTAVDRKVIGKTKVLKGAFELKGVLAEPDLLQLTIPGEKQGVDLFIGNDKVKLKGNIAALGNVSVDGSPTQTDFEAFKKEFNGYFEAFSKLGATIQGEKDPSKRESLMQEYNASKEKIKEAAIQFAKNKSASGVSALALFVVAPLFENSAELESSYNQLSPLVKSNSFGKGIEKKLADEKIGMVGSQAIEFTQKDVDGKPVSLASFRGKYVLVDFWASWCRPCRAENPNVVQAYQSFKDKNFTVLGVSLDQSKPNWLEAIKADNLTWTHVSDLLYWNNAVAQLYHIQSIPANILVDPTGKIIARDIRGEALQQKLTELLK